MSNELPILNQISIPEPCHASWDEMSGDDKSRHCAQCEKSVFHLSNMTATEATRVVEEFGGDLCVRGVFSQSDGRLITKPTRRERILQVVRKVVATAVAVPMITLLPGCSKETLPGPIGDWFGSTPEVHDGRMGDAVVSGQVSMGGIGAPPAAEEQPAVDGEVVEVEPGESPDPEDLPATLEDTQELPERSQLKMGRVAPRL